MLEIFAVVMTGLSVALLAMKVFALVDCVRRPEADFEFKTKLTKNTWLVILGISILAHVIVTYPMSLFNLAGTVAAAVYLAQLRSPASI